MTKYKQTSFYLPGLISLVLLPVFCIPYLITTNSKATKKIHVIELNWWNPHQQIPSELRPPFDKYPKRQYQTTNLTDNKDSNSMVFNMFQKTVHRLIETKDTLTGVHLQLLETSTYGNFIEALNILLKEKAKTYFILENDIWVYNYFPDTTMRQKSYPLFVCGGKRDRIVSDDVIDETEINSQKYLSFNLLPLILLYLAMVILTILKLRRQFKNGYL